MEFTIKEKQFKVCDFENEFTLRQSETGTNAYMLFIDNLQKIDPKLFGKIKTDKDGNAVISSPKDLVKMMGDVSKTIDYGLYSQILAISSWEKTESGYEYIDENLEFNSELIYKYITPKQMKELKYVIEDFFTFIGVYITDAFEMHTQILKKVVNPTRTS